MLAGTFLGEIHAHSCGRLNFDELVSSWLNAARLNFAQLGYKRRGYVRRTVRIKVVLLIGKSGKYVWRISKIRSSLTKEIPYSLAPTPPAKAPLDVGVLLPQRPKRVIVTPAV
jgi:hypothetical protein